MSDVFSSGRGAGGLPGLETDWEGRPLIRFADFAGVPIAANAPAPAAPQRNAFTSGVLTGIDQAQGSGYGALAALGRLTGIGAIERFGTEGFERNQREAQQSQRPDLVSNPWDEGGPSFLPWLANRAGQTLPYMAGVLASGAALTPFLPASVMGAAGAVGARFVPQLIGGGRGLAGKAATEAGEAFAKRFVGSAIAGAPLGVGSMYGEAIERGDPEWGDAAKAFALGLPYGALEALAPATLARGLEQGFRTAGKAGAVAGLLKGMGASAITEAPTEAMQTVLEQSFRPDIPADQKIKNVVDAFLTGGAVGALFGVGPGVRKVQSLRPNASNDELQTEVDDKLFGPEAFQDELPFTNQWDGIPVNPPAGVRPNEDGQLFLPFNNETAWLNQGSTGEPILPGLQGEASVFPPGRVDEPQLPGGQGEASVLPPPALSTLFATVDTPTLTRLRERAELDIAAAVRAGNEPEPAARRQLAVLRAEESRRARGGEPDQVRPVSLFSEEEMLQAERPYEPPPQSPTEQEIARTAFLDTVRKRAGQKALPKWLEQTKATNDVELAAEVLNQLETRNPSAALRKIATSFGLYDKEGREVDLDRDLAGARAVLERMQLNDMRTGVPSPELRAITERVADLEQKKAVIDAAQALRNPQPTAAADLPADNALELTGDARQGITEPAAPAAVEPPVTTQQVLGAVQQQAAQQGANTRMAELLAPLRQPVAEATAARERAAAEAQAAPVRQAAFDQARAPMPAMSREEAFAAAEAQRAQQEARARETAFPEAREQQAQQTPTRFDITMASDGDGFRDPARVKTVAGLNNLSGEQQEAILGRIRSLNPGDVSDEQMLAEFIRRAPNQRALRAQLAEMADVDPQVFERAIPRQARDPMFIGRPVEAPAANPFAEKPKNNVTMKRISKARAWREFGVEWNGNSEGFLVENDGRRAVAFRDADGQFMIEPLGADGKGTGEARIVKRNTARLAPNTADNSNIAFLTPTMTDANQQALPGYEVDTLWAEMAKRLNMAARQAVQFVQTASGLPRAVLQRAQVMKMPLSSIRGVSYDNKTYVVRDAIRSRADLQEIVLNNATSATGVQAKSVPMTAGDLRAAINRGEVGFLLGTLTDADQNALSSEQFDAAWAKVSKRLNPELRNSIIIVNTKADLPQAVLQAAQAEGVPFDSIRGVMHDGKSYIVRNMVTSEADLQEVVLHELLGHAGARKLLGRDHQQVMSRIFDDAGGIEGLRALAAKYNVGAVFNDYIAAAQERGLTDARKAALADELLAQAAGTATGKVSTALREWAGKAKQALVKFLRSMGMGALADRFSKFDALDMAVMLRDMRVAAAGPGRAELETTAFLRSPQQQDATVQRAVGALGRLVDRVTGGDSPKTIARPLALNWSSMGHIQRVWGKMFDVMPRDAQGNVIKGAQPLRNGIDMFMQAHQGRVATANILAQIFDQVDFKLQALKSKKPEAAKILNELMRLTELQIDPRKTWAEHSHLQDAKNAPALRKRVEKVNAEYRRLKQMGGAEIYTQLVQINEMQNFAQMTTQMRNLIIQNPIIAQQIPSAAVDPMDAFKKNDAALSDPKKARDFWEKALDDMHAKVGAYLKSTEGEVKTIEAEEKNKTVTQKKLDEKKAIVARIEPLQVIYQRVLSSKIGMNRSPYFHMGRTGDYFVAFRLAETEKGVADIDKMRKVANRLNQLGFKDLALTQENPNSQVYIRVETDQQMNDLYAAVRAMQKEGLVDNKAAAIRARRKSADGSFDKIEKPKWLEKYITALASQFEPPEGASEQLKEAMQRNQSRVIAQAQELWLDSMSDSSIAKVLTHREDVQGSSTDMLRSFAWRYQLSVNALANMTASQRINEAFRVMFSKIQEAQADDRQDILVLQDVANEINIREAERPLTLGNTWVDKVRAVNHAYFLGMSPSYVLVNLTQPMVLTWPELARRQGVGFAKAFGAMASVTPTAFKVVSAMMREGMKIGINRVPDAPLTADVLKNANIDQKDRDLLLSVAKRGFIDIGSFARELARLAEGREDSGLDKSLRWAAAFGYYSETLSRVIAALAAAKLYNGKPEGRDAYIDQVVNDTMLNYQSWYTARATGKAGVAGQLTPIAASFHTYAFQVTEKLYREMHDSIKGETPKERAEARRFLGAHLAAVTTLAGTLGIPFASVMARVAEKAVDMFGSDDDEPYDIKIAYRNWLANVFGKEIGEVVARGLPRMLLNADLSTRAGEQDLLPFSRFLTDRRKFEDAIKDFVFDTAGSPLSMVSNIVVGGREFLNGNYLEGAKKLVPVAIKGPTEAYRMSELGYVDNRGNILPMEAGAADILAQAVGFTPSNKAEYNEQQNFRKQRQGEMSRMASTLRQRLVTAIERQDTEAFSEALARARTFDAANPTFAVLPRLPGVLRSRAIERARAEALGTPIGINPRDLRGIEQMQFANY